MASSRGQRVEDIYEQQNDQRLDELHSKIRTLRGITTDIHDDVESQNLMLDQTGDQFSSFGTALGQASHRAKQAFGLLTNGSIVYRPWKLAVLIVAIFTALWLLSKVYYWFASSPPA
ncbi:Bet1-like protein [Coprinopsis sp. MPI-PUGE-AT-0042]|nr:Bet1-like protein [Coprinopsis sp. MPI-PUGE-AT-0042]